MGEKLKSREVRIKTEIAQSLAERDESISNAFQQFDQKVGNAFQALEFKLTVAFRALAEMGFDEEKLQALAQQMQTEAQQAAQQGGDPNEQPYGDGGPSDSGAPSEQTESDVGEEGGDERFNAD